MDSALPTVTGLPWKGVKYFSTTRQGGVSAGPWSSLNLGLHTDDDGAHVAANRQRLGAMAPSEPLWLKQVHGADVFDADGMPETVQGRAMPGPPPAADAAVTATAGRVLAIMTADCLPVVLASADACVLGVAHAGWRGLANGVLENTLGAMRRRAPEGARWRAWIGPAISQRHFEVGRDVYEAFAGADPGAAVFFAEKGDGKWLADLPGIARYRLHNAGVANIELSGQCTFGQADMYYSFRRASTTGRLATLAWLEPADPPGQVGSDLP
ncbi:peptidoglycan editing factor PgeF [Pollutimonas sp. H1-120]|uniref:peptidoglycan editing factor PgeF n=1 Tax=Pollutimonas sp. H1-120 TaxID=3148824 RepID=UPI003B52D2E4